jgi:vacuolar-type H+-ATPase subunit E/Vma4
MNVETRTQENSPARLDALQEHVLQEASQRAEKILTDLQGIVEEVNQDLDHQVDYFENVRIVELKEELEAKTGDVRNDLARDASNSVLKFKQDSLSRAISEIVSRFKENLLQDLDYYYNTYLFNLISSAFKSTLFKEYYMILSDRDRAYIQDHPEYLEQFNKPVKIRDTTIPDDEFGCIVEDIDGTIKFDQQLSKRVESQLKYLKTKLSPILFEGA